MPELEIQAHADTYVVEDQPDQNFGDETTMLVRTELDANRRAYVLLDMDQVPDDFAGWRDPTYIEVQLVSTQNPITENRQINLQELDSTFDELGLTWTTQPGLDTGTFGFDAPTGETLHFDLLSVLSVIPLSGTWPLRLVDDAEDDDSLEGPFEQACATREHDTRQPATFVGTYAAQRRQDLSSSLTVRRSSSDDLPSDVRPRFSREEDLASQIEPYFSEHVTGIVEVRAIPIDDDHAARAAGRVSITLDGALDDVEAILDEVGTPVDVDGASRRAIVQLVDAVDEALPTHRPSNPAELSRGDAVLFAIGDGTTFTPGERVTWQGLEFRVVGTLDEEQVTDEALFREVGLRQLASTHGGRAIGTVSTA